MDYFAGLDISMDETHVCVLDREGVVIHESKTASTAPGDRRPRKDRRRPARNSMRLSGATSALRSTIALWTSMAQFTASTTLRNSMIEPSPVRLTMRP